MFVTTLGTDNLDCTKMNAHFKKIHCLSRGGVHSPVEVSITSPTSALILLKTHGSVPHTNILQLSSLLQRATNDILPILVKAQSSTRSTGLRSPTVLGIRSQDLGLPDE